MEDYLNKIKGLPLERLEHLAAAYRETIAKINSTLREASIVGMGSIVEYNQHEVDKKKAELTEIERLIAELKAK